MWIKATMVLLLAARQACDQMSDAAKVAFVN
jgi:hypothetical protein